MTQQPNQSPEPTAVGASGCAQGLSVRRVTGSPRHRLPVAFSSGRLHVMTNTRQIPTPLSVVSYLFLLMGIMAAIGIIGELTQGSIRLDFDLLGFWIFFGLRRYSQGWRTCALSFIWLQLIALPIVFVYGFFGSGPAFIKIFGVRYADIPIIWVSVVSAVLFLLVLWMYRVLTRPSIRSSFYVESQTPAA